MDKNLCVLIPSYNEARTIGDIVSGIRAGGLTAYVVDDGSSDDTAALAERAGAIVVKHPRNRGKGASLREGLRHIVKYQYDGVVIMDGDGQHKVSDIGNFTKIADESGADMVVGNRMSDISNMPFVRIQTNRFMSFFISRISGQYVPDTQCGFRYIRRAALEKITLESSNFEIESEMIIKAARAGFKISSVPIQTVYEDEESRINPVLDTLRFIAFIVRISLKR